MIQELKIRSATVADHAELVKLAKTSKYTKDFSNRVMFSSDAAYEKGWILKASLPDRIIGFTCVRHKVREPVTMLYFITVDPLCRSLTLGEKLLTEVMRLGPHSQMQLNVMKENERAVKFYRRLGFWLAGEAMDGHAHRMAAEFGGKFIKEEQQ